MPLQRRVPKRGFNNARFAKRYEVINLDDLAGFDSGTTVTPEVLKSAGLVGNRQNGVKVLGTGELSIPLTVQAHAFSKSAAQKIEAAGGKVEVI